MKTLKITFLLLAVLVLTISGQSSDAVTNDTDEATYKTEAKYDLLAHAKKNRAIKNQG